MVTGPHADHTSGIPFQGHYMVINTNTEVYAKRARLVSPLYKMNATSLCFKLYYHMYGINIGTLRVYMKPESVEMAEILREDTESEASNEYVVFEIKGMRFCASWGIFYGHSHFHKSEQISYFTKLDFFRTFASQVS